MINSIIGRGLAGWHSQGVHEGNSCSSSGGTLEGYLKDARDNTPIYDASDCNEDQFITFVFRGPLIDVRLEPGQIRKLFSGTTMTYQAGGSVIDSSSYVAVDVFLDLLHQCVPGVRFGIVRNGKAIWDGEILCHRSYQLGYRAGVDNGFDQRDKD
jgi:hypothetical protein